MLGGWLTMTAGAALAAVLLTTGTASADPKNYCRVTNPPSGASANPCTTYVDESWVYSAGGDWELRVESADGRVRELSSENGDPASGGPGLFRRYDWATARAVTPGSYIHVGNSDHLASTEESGFRWPAAEYVVEDDGCVPAPADGSLPRPLPSADGPADRSQCVIGAGGAVIRYTLMLPEAASAENPVPLVIAGHGFGGSRAEFTPTAEWAAYALNAGYAFLAFDSRGFGDSGGQAEFDHIDFEGADVEAIVDKLSRDPRIARDAPGDPRVGMLGLSYGGGLQFVAAARDDRIDAIVPGWAWHNLYDAVFPRGVLKAGWGTLVPGALVPALHYPGWMSTPADRWEAGTMNPIILRGIAEAVATGQVSDEVREWLEDRGPSHLLDDFDTPTMIIHGQNDTLFQPSQAAANFEALRRKLPGEKLRMRWDCKGHGTCKPYYFERRSEHPIRVMRDTIRFLDRWVKDDESVDLGPTFAYTTPDGTWQGAPSYPPKPKSLLKASGGGIVTAGGETSTGGAASFRTGIPPRPQASSLKIDIDHPGEGLIVGASTVTITATGAGAGSDTGTSAVLFLRLVDKRTGTVLGNQTTPVVLPTDGRSHSTTLDLEPVVWQIGRKDQLALEIVGNTVDFEPQRGAAVMNLERVEVTVPVTSTR